MTPRRIRSHSLLLIALFLTPILAAAQAPVTSPYEGRLSRASLTVGPGFSAGASTFLDSPEGYKIKPLFDWSIDAHGSYPLTPVINAMFGLGVESRGGRMHHHESEDLRSDFKVTYFNITPGFSFGGFTLGFNFGFPMSATNTGFLQNFGGPIPTAETSRDIPDEAVSVLLEPQLGAVIPIIDTETGWLSLTVVAGYGLNELISQEYVAGIPVVGPRQEAEQGDFHTAAGRLGLRFEFAIPNTERD